MKDFHNVGRISLWEAKEGSKAVATGVIQFTEGFEEGEEFSVVLFANQSDNPRAPKFSGFISLRDEQQPASPAAKPAAAKATRRAAKPKDNSAATTW